VLARSGRHYEPVLVDPHSTTTIKGKVSTSFLPIIEAAYCLLEDLTVGCIVYRSVYLIVGSVGFNWDQVHE
jgi:hypothetical protein